MYFLPFGNFFYCELILDFIATQSSTLTTAEPSQLYYNFITYRNMSSTTYHDQQTILAEPDFADSYASFDAADNIVSPTASAADAYGVFEDGDDNVFQESTMSPINASIISTSPSVRKLEREYTVLSAGMMHDALHSVRYRVSSLVDQCNHTLSNNTKNRDELSVAQSALCEAMSLLIDEIPARADRGYGVFLNSPKAMTQKHPLDFESAPCWDIKKLLNAWIFNAGGMLLIKSGLSYLWNEVATVFDNDWFLALELQWDISSGLFPSPSGLTVVSGNPVDGEDKRWKELLLARVCSSYGSILLVIFWMHCFQC